VPQLGRGAAGPRSRWPGRTRRQRVQVQAADPCRSPPRRSRVEFLDRWRSARRNEPGSQTPGCGREPDCQHRGADARSAATNRLVVAVQPARVEVRAQRVVSCRPPAPRPPGASAARRPAGGCARRPSARRDDRSRSARCRARPVRRAAAGRILAIPPPAGVTDTDGGGVARTTRLRTALDSGAAAGSGSACDDLSGHVFTRSTNLHSRG